MRIFKYLFCLIASFNISQQVFAEKESINSLKGKDPGFSITNNTEYTIDFEVKNGTKEYFKFNTGPSGWPLKPNETYDIPIDNSLKTTVKISGISASKSFPEVRRFFPIEMIFEPGKTIYITFDYVDYSFPSSATHYLGSVPEFKLGKPKIYADKPILKGLINKTKAGYSTKYNVTDLDIEK